MVSAHSLRTDGLALDFFYQVLHSVLELLHPDCFISAHSSNKGTEKRQGKA